MATTDEKIYVTIEQAITALPEGKYVHTFRQAGFALLGCDWEREDLITALRAAPAIEVTGPTAQGMKHGLAIYDDVGPDPLFIETVTRTDE